MSQGQLITSVWSSYGHRFMSGDADDTDSCLHCGAHYLLLIDPRDADDQPEDDSTYVHVRGVYQANDGSAPQECTWDTGMVHGYERHCDGVTGRGCEEWQARDGEGCSHTDHGCNCVLCQ